MGRNIRYLAGMHDIHQSELAAYVGISVQALGNILSGRSQPRTTTARRLAEAFGIGIDDLFADAGPCVRAGAEAFERAPIRQGTLRQAATAWRNGGAGA